jgi:uncharacterized protein YndB with AHSA1/START domain
MSTDRIERTVLLRAPLARVWRAIADSREFGTWFGARIDGPFEAGSTVRAEIVCTTVDAEVAAMQKPMEGAAFDFFVERVEPPHHLSFRWHQDPIEEGTDPATQPTTLVTLDLAEEGDGVRLTITESGFDALPEAARAEAFRRNAEGWELQTKLVAKYLAGAN